MADRTGGLELDEPRVVAHMEGRLLGRTVEHANGRPSAAVMQRRAQLIGTGL